MNASGGKKVKQDFQNRIESGISFETRLKLLKEKVRKNENIGISLIRLSEHPEAVDKIHQEAERCLQQGLNSYSGSLGGNAELVFISLCLIAQTRYNSNYYRGVERTYKKLYQLFSEQRIEGMIRNVLASFGGKFYANKPGERRINIALMNTIVPQYYLPDFFDFIYDIYTINMDYRLPDDIEDEFRFVYEGIGKDLAGDNDDLELRITRKTYKLIKATKMLIADAEKADSVIRLSVEIIRLIDSKIWERPCNVKNPYLQYGFDEWCKKLEEEKEKEKSRNTPLFYSSWEPKFRLNGDRVYLSPPVHKVKSDYDYRQLRVELLDGNNLIWSDDRPDIREIIGGYKVIPPEMRLENPLGKLRYRVTAGKKLIYDSQDILYRDFLVFDSQGRELKNNTDYQGTAVFCFAGDREDLPVKGGNEYYHLSAQDVRFSDVYVFGETVFSFSSLTRPGIFGELNGQALVREQGSSKDLEVYSKVDFLVFECEREKLPDYIVINGAQHSFDMFRTTISGNDSRLKTVLDLKLEKPDIYKIGVPGIAAFEFVYDPELAFEMLHIEGSEYMVEAESSLIDTVFSETVTIDRFPDEGIPFLYKGRRYIYQLAFDFDIYQLDQQPWCSCRDDLWGKEIQHNSVLRIWGTDYDSLSVYSDSGKNLFESLPLKKDGLAQKIDIGFLKSHCEDTFLTLCFLKEGKVETVIFLYNRCVLDEKKSEIEFDPVTAELLVSPAFHGKGQVYFKVFDENGQEVFKRDVPESGEIIRLKPMGSFQKYTFRFYEKSTQLFWGKDEEIGSFEKVFYAYKDFRNRTFPIRKVSYYHEKDGDFVKDDFLFEATFVEFRHQTGPTTFEGEIFAEPGYRIFRHREINPVEIEICSNVINGSMDLYITKNGDGLLLDTFHKGIMNCLEHKTAPDIFSYRIDVNRGNY